MKINILKTENETKTSWKLTLEERWYDSYRKTEKEVPELAVHEMIMDEMEVQH